MENKRHEILLSYFLCLRSGANLSSNFFFPMIPNESDVFNASDVSRIASRIDFLAEDNGPGNRGYNGILMPIFNSASRVAR